MNELSNRLTKGITAVLLFCSVTAHVAAASAQSTGAPPLPMNNRTPFTLPFISATAPDYTLAPSRHQLSTHFDISSHSIIESSGDSRIEIDGETLRLALGWQYRPSDRWIIKAELPLLFHSGGFLDSSIDRWHQLTSLPDGERNRQPRNALLFGFRDNSQLVLLNKQQSNVGDLQFSAALQLSAPALTGQTAWRHNSWVQLGVKLPTGNRQAFSGSGSTDFALSVHHNRHQADSDNPWTISADAFALIAGNSDLIDGQNTFQWQVNIRAAKALKRYPRLTPEVQLRYRSATYDNPVNALGSDSLGIDVGATIYQRQGYWKMGISEDLDVDSAPDVTFYFQYNRRTGTDK
ncbi:MAG: DUF3187 family protein [Gammaproteobacteria bacterium]